MNISTNGVTYRIDTEAQLTTWLTLRQTWQVEQFLRTLPVVARVEPKAA